MTPSDSDAAPDAVPHPYRAPYWEWVRPRPRMKHWAIMTTVELIAPTSAAAADFAGAHIDGENVLHGFARIEEIAPKVCARCGDAYWHRRKGTMYCSERYNRAAQQQAYRDRKKASS